MLPPLFRTRRGTARATAGAMRFARRKSQPSRTPRRDSLRVGFVATLDCAVLVAAQELGLFAKHGLRVRLSREIGWATTRDKLLHDELDAVAGHASLLVSIYCGLGVLRRPCLTGLLLGANGSAITLSNALWDAGVRDAASLARFLHDPELRRPLTFGVVLDVSSQNHHLRHWLQAGGVDPDRDVRLAVVPSPLMFDAFRRGHLDGYCVAEPWNSAAVDAGLGWVATTTAELAPEHPEKALIVLREFAEQRDDEHVRLVAALVEASRFCQHRGNRPELVRMLARPAYFDVPPAVLANSLIGPFHAGHDRHWSGDLIVYEARRVGCPNRARGRRILDQVAGLLRRDATAPLRRAIIPRIFREDIFERALARTDLVTSARTPATPPPLLPDEAADDSPHRRALPKIPATEPDPDSDAARWLAAAMA